MEITINKVDLQAETGDLIATVTMPLGGEGTAPYTILIPEAALDDRALVYGLASRDDALLAVLREHAKRLNDLPEKADVTIKRDKAKVSDEAAAIILAPLPVDEPTPAEVEAVDRAPTTLEALIAAVDNLNIRLHMLEESHPDA